MFRTKIDILDPAVDVHVDVAEKRRGDLDLRFANGNDSPLLARLVTPDFILSPAKLLLFYS